MFPDWVHFSCRVSILSSSSCCWLMYWLYSPIFSSMFSEFFHPLIYDLLKLMWLLFLSESDFLDTFFGSCLSILLIITVFPLCSFTGRTLLQTTPTHMIGHLDKCLREASTQEGVLEFRNEHFWTLGYNDLVGTLHVRVRRDANEQVVLSHLTNRLSNLVSDLTIQVFKDEWSWQPSPSRLMRHENASLLKYSLPSVSSSSSSSLIPSKSSSSLGNSTLVSVDVQNETPLSNNHDVKWTQDVWWKFSQESVFRKLKFLKCKQME